MGKSKTTARSAKGKGSARGSRAAAQRALRGSRGGRGSRSTWIGAAIVVVVAVAIVLGVVLTGKNSQQRRATATAIWQHPITSTVGGRTTPPPWPVPADPRAAVQKAGLPMLSSEGVVEHIHAHLDILVNGKPVKVPAGIGIDEQAGTISPVHAHDTSGVIHIESPEKVPFSLAQFFTEWQVALSAGQLGGLHAGNGDTLHVYVNGKQVTGNPAAITIHAHDEIALVYGPANAHPQVPKSYQFPQGE